jgi:hypothetical protein
MFSLLRPARSFTQSRSSCTDSSNTLGTLGLEGWPVPRVTPDLRTEMKRIAATSNAQTMDVKDVIREF